MEFHEKLQELRKSRGLTQEELAEALFVSRTAVSKWESGRGYPSIDSLKEISQYFSVSIDSLLSGDKLISLAERENSSNIRNMCDLITGVIDVFSFMLVILPLYPNTVGEYVYSVNLLQYGQTAAFNIMVYKIVFGALIATGVIKILLAKMKFHKGSIIATGISIALSIFIILYLALAREAYAIVVAFLLLVIKVMLLLKYMKAGR